MTKADYDKAIDNSVKRGMKIVIHDAKARIIAKYVIGQSLLVKTVANGCIAILEDILKEVEE